MVEYCSLYIQAYIRHLLRYSSIHGLNNVLCITAELPSIYTSCCNLPLLTVSEAQLISVAVDAEQGSCQ